jgi:hypothetical protein
MSNTFEDIIIKLKEEHEKIKTNYDNLKEEHDILVKFLDDIIEFDEVKKFIKTLEEKNIND